MQYRLRSVDVVGAPGGGFERIDFPVRAHDVAEEPRVVTAARQKLADFLSRLDIGIGQHVGGLPVHVKLSVIRRARRISDGFGDEVGHRRACGRESHQTQSDG